jgi:diguanylate cyclase (GGDEF)-like protein
MATRTLPELERTPHIEPLRHALQDVLQRMVEASDVVLVELECPTLFEVPLSVRRASAQAPRLTSLAVRGAAVPASTNLPRATLWVSAAHDRALDQARSWPVLVGLLLDAHLSRLSAERVAQGALEIANRDPATGLGNRRAWEQNLRTETVRAHRSQRPMTLLVIDIDGLKAVNDVRGHAAGDQLIFRAAEVLTALRRATDGVCRLGGDEFGITAPDTDEVQARFLAARVRKGLQEVGVRVSLGYAVSTADVHADDLWHQADVAMYQDKRARRPSWDLNKLEAEQAQRDAVIRMPRP